MRCDKNLCIHLQLQYLLYYNSIVKLKSKYIEFLSYNMSRGRFEKNKFITRRNKIYCNIRENYVIKLTNILKTYSSTKDIVLSDEYEYYKKRLNTCIKNYEKHMYLQEKYDFIPKLIEPLMWYPKTKHIVYVSTYVGKDLYYYLYDPIITIDIKLSIISRFINKLNELHKDSIHHGDIKPENMVLGFNE